MVSKNTYLAGLLAVALGATACTKENDQRSGELAGTWQWERTDGGIAHHIHETPLTTGKNIDLKLTADQQYYFYTNGALTAQGTYRLETRNCIHDQKEKLFLNFSDATQTDLMVEDLSADRLELSDEAADGVISRYSRKGTSGN